MRGLFEAVWMLLSRVGEFYETGRSAVSLCEGVMGASVNGPMSHAQIVS